MTEELITIAVVGAHLTGMPLNHELTTPGGVFVESVETATCYRLYELPATLPPKPGLLRVAPGEGGAIALELWALQPAAFAAFVAAIPQPLGIGTLTLADGRQVKGFLVEAIATQGATDITAYGGWRAWITAKTAA